MLSIRRMSSIARAAARRLKWASLALGRSARRSDHLTGLGEVNYLEKCFHKWIHPGTLPVGHKSLVEHAAFRRGLPPFRWQSVRHAKVQGSEVRGEDETYPVSFCHRCTAISTPLLVTYLSPFFPTRSVWVASLKGKVRAFSGRILAGNCDSAACVRTSRSFVQEYASSDSHRSTSIHASTLREGHEYIIRGPKSTMPLVGLKVCVHSRRTCCKMSSLH